MSETAAGIIFFVTVVALTLPTALSQMGRQAKMAKRRGWLDASTPGATVPSKRSLIIALGAALVWLAVSIPAALFIGA